MKEKDYREDKMKIPPPPKDWRFYVKWIGLGLICASIIYWRYM